MPHILDSRDEMLKIDTNNGLQSIEEIGSQIKQTWEEVRTITFPSEYKDIDNVVVAGMGGSAYGTHVIQALFKDDLKVPVFSIPDYELPSWVRSRTLVVLSSYSGNTEETLAAGQDAVKKGAKITGLTSGGKLADFLKEQGVPHYVFTPTYNPCNVPRYALGYSVFGQMMLLSQVGVLRVTQEMYTEVLDAIANVHTQYSVQVATDKNHAKLLAFNILDRMPVIVVAEHLEGAGHVVANAFNETSKTYSEYRVIPEINHHMMEGLQFPKSNTTTLLFLTVHSDLYLPSNEKRVRLTEEVIEQNGCAHEPITLFSKTKIGQVFEFLVYGTYIAFYLAFLKNQNPTPNPWVDWFKEQLKK